MRKLYVFVLIALLAALVAGCSSAPAAQEAAPTEAPKEEAAPTEAPKEEAAPAEAPAADETITLRYAHPNAPATVPGTFADTFAKLVNEKTGGKVTIEVFPSSQLGSLQEMVEQVQNGSIAFHHNTMAAIGSLYQPFEAFDTPFLYQDVDHLLAVTNIDSPVIQQFNQDLIDARGVRLIGTFYFGSRDLTADREIKTPADLEGVKIRSIPFPIYTAAVEGMGAVATPIDWAEVPTSLATGVVNGQENPVDVIYNNNLFETQSHLMLTNHIIAADAVVVNEDVFQGLPGDVQEAIIAAATEAGTEATQSNRDLTADYIQKLKDAGMTVIGPDEGLDLDAFRQQVSALIDERFGDTYGDFYEAVKAVK